MKKRIALSIAVAAMASFLLCGCTNGNTISSEIPSGSEIASQISSEPVSEVKVETSENNKPIDTTDKPIHEELKVAAYSGIGYASKDMAVKAGCAMSNQTLGTIGKGTKLDLSGETENGWYRFNYEGKDGFILKKFVLTEKEYKALVAEEKAKSGKDEKKDNNGEMTEEEYAKLQKARAEARIPEELKNGENNEELDDANLQLQRARAIARSDYATAVLSGVNQARAEAGLPALTMDTTLNNLCYTRAEEISTSWGHNRPDGRNCFTILSDNGVSYSTCGENIAAGQETGSEVVTTWMNSEGHRANILNPSFTKMGIGVYASNDEYGYYWAQIFTD